MVVKHDRHVRRLICGRCRHHESAVKLSPEGPGTGFAVARGFWGDDPVARKMAGPCGSALLRSALTDLATPRAPSTPPVLPPLIIACRLRRSGPTTCFSACRKARGGGNDRHQAMRGYDVMVACQLPKLNARVRFPLPAPMISNSYSRSVSLVTLRFTRPILAAVC